MTKNSGELFAHVLDSLMRCDGIDDVELLCIDSGSSDGTLKRLRSFPAIRIVQIPPGEFGHGRTRNLAVSLTTRPFVSFLVHDASPVREDYLTSLLAPMGDADVAGAYGRQVARETATPVEGFFLEATYPPESRLQEAPRGRAMTVHDCFFSNVSSVLRRQALVSIPFREDVVMSEDIFWSHAALEHGWKVAYAAEASVWHSHSYTLRDVFRRNFDTGASVAAGLGGRTRDMLAYEVDLVLRGGGALLAEGNARWVPYFVVHEGVRSVAVGLGRHWRRLPRRAVQRMSLHGYHWLRTHSHVE